MNSSSSVDDEIRFEVARRLDRLTEEPDRLMRYDANGDGVLDSEEWEVVRALVHRQVAREFQEQRAHALPETVETRVPAEPNPTPESNGPTPEWNAQVVSDAPRLYEGTSDVKSHDGEWGVDTDPHIDLTVRERLSDRYDVLHEIGAGSQGKTYLGRDLETNRFVAIKELAIGKIDDWKSLELFEREQTILEQLDHPNIPAFVDTCEVDAGGHTRLFLIQEFIEGETLEAELERSQFDDSSLRYIAEQVLHTLVYLQDLSPSVIHRDIKPANLIQRADGRVMLVDFGGVQTRKSIDEVGGSTVVGTSGYMPPEQLMGRANDSTDLFALGATLIHLATGHHPSHIPQKRSKFQWRGYASVSDSLVRFIDRLTEPIAEDRFPNARAALAALNRPLGGDWSKSASARGNENGASTGALVPTRAAEIRIPRPDKSFVSVERTVDHLSVRIPATFTKRRIFDGLFYPGVFSALIATAGLPATLVYPMVGVAAAFAIWNLLLCQSSFMFDATPFRWDAVEYHWGIPFESSGSYEFRGARVDRRERRTKHSVMVYYVLQVSANGEWHDIEAGISKAEKNWVAAEMNAFASDALKVRMAEDAERKLIGVPSG